MKTLVENIKFNQKIKPKNQNVKNNLEIKRK